MFGLRSYRPYQGLAIVLHLTVVVLLRMVMLRSRVNPWVATALATMFMFFGSGYADIIWAFQIGFTAALSLGLVHLLLADHNGPVDHRDWLGIAAGAVGLMCSGVALTMVAVVCLATAVRRGVRVALLHTLPLAAIYALWFLKYQENYDRVRPSLSELLGFVWEGVSAALEAIARGPVIASALVIILTCGFLVLWSGDRGWAHLRDRAAAALAMLVGAFLFLTLTAAARAGEYPTDRARESRYLYVMAGLALPAIALAADSLIRRWRLLAAVMAVLLAVSIVGNLGEFADQRKRDLATQGAYRRMMLAIPYLPLARKVPESLRPEPVFAHDVTVGWLLDGADSGRIPRPAMTKGEELSAKVNLALQQTGDLLRDWRTCSPFVGPVESDLALGDAFFIRDGTALVFLLDDDGRMSTPKFIVPAYGEQLLALDGPLRLRIVPRARSTRWCGVQRALPGR
jgi:hypothetical protein